MTFCLAQGHNRAPKQGSNPRLLDSEFDTLPLGHCAPSPSDRIIYFLWFAEILGYPKVVIQISTSRIVKKKQIDCRATTFLNFPTTDIGWVSALFGWTSEVKS